MVVTVTDVQCLLSTQEVCYKDIVQNKSQTLGTPFKMKWKKKNPEVLTSLAFRVFYLEIWQVTENISNPVHFCCGPLGILSCKGICLPAKRHTLISCLLHQAFDAHLAGKRSAKHVRSYKEFIIDKRFLGGIVSILDSGCEI